MLHHVSFAVRDVAATAAAIARMLGAYATRAPSPPFPHGSWFVVLGDAQGSLIELLPWGTVFDPSAPGGYSHDAAMRPGTSSHVLVSTHHASAFVFKVAAQEGWRATLTDALLFQFIKVWIDDAFVLEVMTAEHMAAYVATFSADGLASLDTELRRLERSPR